MSLLNIGKKRELEKCLGIDSGYTINFTDRTFSVLARESVDIAIYRDNYTTRKIPKTKSLGACFGAKSDHLTERLNAFINENDQVYSGVSALADHREATARLEHLYLSFDIKPYPNYRESIRPEQLSKR